MDAKYYGDIVSYHVSADVGASPKCIHSNLIAMFELTLFSIPSLRGLHDTYLSLHILQTQSC